MCVEPDNNSWLFILSPGTQCGFKKKFHTESQCETFFKPTLSNTPLSVFHSALFMLKLAKNRDVIDGQLKKHFDPVRKNSPFIAFKTNVKHIP